MNAVPKETEQAAAKRLFAHLFRQGYRIMPNSSYVYRTADGEPWCRRIRFDHPTDPKEYRPLYWNGAQFVASEPPPPAEGKPLYRLPELLAADPAALVWIVEGEKCAEALAALGLIATTSGSMSSAKGAGWTPLQGRQCIVWPDHDKSGVDYADDVTAKLHLLGCTVETIDVEPLGLPDKGDAVDWLALHPDATAADVLALATLAACDVAMCPDLDLIDLALAKLPADPGAIFERDVLAALVEVRKTDPARYQRVRAAAKKAASVGELDKLTAPKDDGGDVEVFPDVEPWPDPVAGAPLLADVVAILAAHVIADPPTLRAAALWVVHTYCMDTLTVSPLAHISAPEMRCGKTVLLTAMMRLVYRPMLISSITPSAIFRSVELWSPTLGIDEADAFLKDNEEARGLINSGLYREGASVIRCVGDDHTPTKFSTWAPKILCGIGKLAGTIEDRSIPLRMRRKVAGETAANIRKSDPQPWTDLQARIARWAADNLHAMARARPAPAHGLGDRAQDCWEPLLAIADLAGNEWPGLARAAALALHGVEEETPSINVELLRDIEAAFKERHTSRLASRELLELLIRDDEAPWATWNRGSPLSSRQLAARLSDFAIKPKTTRLPNSSQLKGYALADFRDAFTRYLSAEGGISSVPPSQPHSSAVCEALPSVPAASAVRSEKAPQPALDKACNGGTDKNPLPEKKAESGNEVEAFDL